jgi:phytoene dehydrogenase-like protein
MAVVIVGAGLAGLTCARHLQRHNIPVMVLEAADEVGGRVRSDTIDGFTLDRGFQVLFDVYPAVRRNLDLDALELRAFDPGAIIYHDGRRTVLTDPLRDRNWADVAGAVFSPAATLRDKLRTVRLALAHNVPRHDQKAEEDTESILEYLKSLGMSARVIDNFYRPFFAGILLQRDLLASAAPFRFYLRMLVLGRATLPAHGMGAISRQLAAPFRDAGCLRLEAVVAGLLRDGGHVTGVRLENGEEIPADAVVLATDAQVAARLGGLETPGGALHATAVYLAGTRPVYAGRKIVLNAAPSALVNNAQQLTNVVPEYAPPGRHLLSAVVLGLPLMNDRELVIAVMRDLRRMFAGDVAALRALDTYYPLRVYRIRYAQFPQPPGIYATLPPNRTGQPGLYAAAEWTEGSSINGAMTSGEHCAAAIAEDRGSNAGS